MPNYLIAHDLGASGNKATLFTTDGEYVKSRVAGYGTHFFNDATGRQQAAGGLVESRLPVYKRADAGGRCRKRCRHLLLRPNDGLPLLG